VRTLPSQTARQHSTPAALANVTLPGLHYTHPRLTRLTWVTTSAQVTAALLTDAHFSAILSADHTSWSVLCSFEELVASLHPLKGV